MNRQEIAEIRRRLNPEQNAISCVRGCYVNEKREIVSVFTHSLLTLPMEETEKYLSLFKRTLSGVPTRNLLELDFSADQVMEGAQHALLMALRNGALREEETVEAFYQAVIDSLEMEGNYLILLLHDTYDVPMRVRDRGEEMDEDAGDEVFSYILCAICPVKLAKPALSYFDQDNAFHSRDMDWVVSSPELGFLFPRFDDRAPNISGALYFTRDAANRHDEWISAVMGEVGAPMPAMEQRETFQSVLEDALGDELSLEVAQAVREEIVNRIEETASDKEAEPPEISRAEVKNVLEACGISEESVKAFEEKYNEEFGLGVGLSAQNLVDAKRFEVRTPDVVVHVNPERSDLVETRVIDGVKYLLIRADEGVAVNGVNIAIGAEEQ